MICKPLPQESGSTGRKGGVIDQSQVAPSSFGPPDVFYYKLTVQEGNKRTSLYFNDVTAPGSLRPFLSLLQELAWEQAKKGK